LDPLAFPEARKRFGLCVLNYQVTCNHVHLLVRDRGAGEIERSRFAPLLPPLEKFAGAG
jgi:hypothetical protein